MMQQPSSSTGLVAPSGAPVQMTMQDITSLFSLDAVLETLASVGTYSWGAGRRSLVDFVRRKKGLEATSTEERDRQVAAVIRLIDHSDMNTRYPLPPDEFHPPRPEASDREIGQALQPLYQSGELTPVQPISLPTQKPASISSIQHDPETGQTGVVVIDGVVPDYSKMKRPHARMTFETVPYAKIIFTQLRTLIVTYEQAQSQEHSLSDPSLMESLKSLYNELSQFVESHYFGTWKLEKMVARLQKIAKVERFAIERAWFPWMSGVSLETEMFPSRRGGQVSHVTGAVATQHPLPVTQFIDQMRGVFPFKKSSADMAFTDNNLMNLYFKYHPGEEGKWYREKRKLDISEKSLIDLAGLQPGSSAGPFFMKPHSAVYASEMELGTRLLRDLDIVISSLNLEDEARKFFLKWDFTYLANLFGKDEVYSSEKSERVIAATNTFAYLPVMMLLQLASHLFYAYHEKVPVDRGVSETYRYARSLAKFSPFDGGMNRFLKFALEQTVEDGAPRPLWWAYADNLFILAAKKTPKGIKRQWQSHDVESMEGVHDQNFFTYTMIWLMQEIFNHNEPEFNKHAGIAPLLVGPEELKPTLKQKDLKGKTGGTFQQHFERINVGRSRIPVTSKRFSKPERLTTAWVVYLTRLVPSLSRYTVMTCGDQQFFFPGMASGVAPTFFFNHARMLFTFSGKGSEGRIFRQAWHQSEKMNSAHRETGIKHEGVPQPIRDAAEVMGMRLKMSCIGSESLDFVEQLELLGDGESLD